MNDPAQLPRPQRPQARLPVRSLAILQRHADVAHRLDHAIAATGFDRREQGVDLPPGGRLGLREDFSPSVSERDKSVLTMVWTDSRARRPARDEARHHAVQMRLVHVERPADLGRRSPAPERLSQFVQNAGLNFANAAKESAHAKFSHSLREFCTANGCQRC